MPTYSDFRNVKTQADFDHLTEKALIDVKRGALSHSEFCHMTDLGRDALNSGKDPTYHIQESKQHMNEGFMVIETRGTVSKSVSAKFKNRVDAEKALAELQGSFSKKDQ